MFHPQQYKRGLGPCMYLLKDVYQKYGKLLKWNSEPESILDLGVGEGAATKNVILPMVPKNIKEYVGADISESMLKAATETINYDKFIPFQMDVSTKNLPIEMKNRFHHIFSSNLLHHVRDLRQALTNIQDMLKPGGQLFFNILRNLITDETFEKLDQTKWAKYNNRQSISPFYKYDNPMKEYEKLLNILGYVDCELHMECCRAQLSEHAFRDLMTAVNFRLPFVEEADREEYTRDFIEETMKVSLVEVIIDEHSKEKIVIPSFDTIIAVAFKRL